MNSPATGTTLPPPSPTCEGPSRRSWTWVAAISDRELYTICTRHAGDIEDLLAVVLAWTVAIVIGSLNAWLLFQTFTGWLA